MTKKVLYVGAALLGAGPAYAQQAAAPSVEEIVVTASKRAERLLDVPQSMTALTGSALEQIQAQSFEDYATLVPNLSFTSKGPGRNQITLRGITSGSGQPNATVGTYVDETPFGSSSVYALGNNVTPDVDTFDLDRVEILRGPQGTLYGASTLGGLVKYVTKGPDFTRVQVRGFAEVTTTEGGGTGFALKGVVNLPINDKVALRASAFRRTDAGFIDNPSRGQSNVNQARFVGGRAALELRPADTLTVRLNAYAQDIHTNGTPAEDIDPRTLQPLYGDLVQHRFVATPLTSRFRGLNATVDWNLGWAKLLSSTSYMKVSTFSVTDLTAMFGPLLQGLTGQNLAVGQSNVSPMRKVTQELRLSSPSNKSFEWQVGAFITHERSDLQQDVPTFLPNGAPPPFPFNRLGQIWGPSRYFEYAGFADVTYYLTPEIDVSAGLRWSRNEQNYTQRSGGLLITGDPDLFNVIPAQSADQSWTYSISPRWHVTPDVMAYARVAKGYRPGGPNGVVPQALGVVPSSFQPDSLTNYEIGLKAAVPSQRLRFDLAAFYIDWSAVQLPGSIGAFSFIANGGAAKSKGFEASVNWMPFAGLTLDANLAFTDATLTKDALEVGGRNGDRLPTVPRWGGSISAEYRTQLFGDVAGFAGATWRYVGSRMSDYSVGQGRVQIPSYDLLDLRVGVESDRWSANLFVKNLADRRGIISTTTLTLDPTTSPLAATVVRPRTIGISITGSF